MGQRRNHLLTAAAVMTALVMAGCPPTNNSGQSQKKTSSSSTTTPTSGFSPAPTGSATALSIINVTVASSTSGAVASSTATVLFNSSLNNGVNLSNVCTSSGGAGGAGANPCFCRFSWREINQSTGVGLNRTVDTAVTAALPFSATCAAPGVWDSEIPEGTPIDVTIAPDTAGGNTNTISCNTFRFTKQTTSVDGDFRDAEGRAIKNIAHYVCHDYFNKALSIAHGTGAGTARPDGSSFAPPDVPLANVFTTDNTGVTAQAYWYDFYIRNSEVGSINSGASGLICPRVAISRNGAIAPQFFPLDSTFAVALNSSRRYTIPVAANIRVISGAGAATAEQGVLGYAIKPEADGTCPALPDSTGLTRRTFRLRRYVVNYPVRYNADGTTLSTSQPINTVYVLDRPVDKTGQDPLKPLTRLGPKPCPFSFNMNQSATTDTTATTVGPVSHSCTVGTSKLPFSFGDVGNSHFQPATAAAPATLSGAGRYILPQLHGIPDGKKYGLVSNDASAATVRGNNRTYCLGNGTSSGLRIADNTTTSCSPGTPTISNATSSRFMSNDFTNAKNIDGTMIARSDCPIFPPPAANLTSQGDLHIRPMKGFVPEWLEDTTFKACAFQSSNPVDPDIVVAYNGYQYPQPGDRATDDPKKARAFYCARSYPDPSWIEPPSGGPPASKLPGHCDSGRPKGGGSALPSKYYIPKALAGTSEDRGGYIDWSATPNKRTVQDAMVTSYAIMNERSYSCAFTYNPAMSRSYDPTGKLTDLVTPRSGCCQRGSGSGKTNGLSRGGAQQTAENRGIHSLVDAVGPWYNRYGQPAFNMQSVLLSAAPFQLVPNRGAHNQADCYTAGATHKIDTACQAATATPTYDSNFSLAGHAIVSGSSWGTAPNPENSGTPEGCYDPSEDP